MTKEIEFIFDCASPNAYLAQKALHGLLERTGATVRYTPCLLGGIFKATGNQAPMISYGGIPNKSAYHQLEFKRFIDRHGLTKFNFNPDFPINTLLMMRGAIVAEDEGQLDPYVDAMLHHMWEAPKKMDDPAIAANALSASGFDGEALLARTQEPEIKARLIANTEKAVARGAFGIPTFFIGEEMFFGKERFNQMEELLLT